MEEAVTALLANVAGGRRYWGRAETGAARPYVVLHRIDGVASYTHAGRVNLTPSRIQADCIGDTAMAAKQTARDVVAALDGQSGGGIQAVFIDTDGRDLQAGDAGEVNTLFGVQVDIIVHHSA